MHRLLSISFILVLVIAGALRAEPDREEVAAADVITRYQEALRKQSDQTRNVAMDVTMEASIPKLKKHGRMNALRRISDLGRITYKILGFSGDDTVKKEVMARFMTAEVEAAQNPKGNIGITSENYTFKYKGESDKNGRIVHVVELKPKQKRVGLFKGELWLDRETYLPVRESGRLVKNPSVFIKKMEFTRDYDIREGVAWLVRMESRTDTRIVGRADLHINYANFTNAPEEAEPVEEARGRS